MAAELRAWDRRADESAKAFEAFVVYRDMGAARSLVRTSQEHGKSIATVTTWCGRHEWVKRVAAYDTDIARRASERTEEDDVEALARQVRTMREVQQRMAKRLLTATDRVSAAEAGRLLMAAAKEEREARRLPAKVAVEGGIDITFGWDDGTDDAGDDDDG